ncbi:hypothetical protein COT20_02670 [bacterium (Candidatus Gribaldobacteria) CG08_land_8_20_14_0_20_39_15]|uniref:Uncharacterized protein n=1 Tax=bacterium (Candidatus Gribaldobacteria) CG08_land_8_20_14_0_20_39_15 TaxID=2014273 RepID=A0A2M6XTW7_9BACT|nr:MAG: hypothetical protein COT20_02670 [bacterium (Candidatus Gribaldobacteria) CG08_land_8_20_14_0_20_39_15]
MTKITIKKSAKKSTYVNVPPEKSFWFCDGQVAKNLKELAVILEKMPQNVFEHHANNNKNDFSRWIADVFGDVALAKGIQKINSSKVMAKKIKAKL